MITTKRIDEELRDIEGLDWITALLKAYGLSAQVPTPAVTPTKSLREAFEVCINLEADLFAPYEWLIQNAEDQTEKK